jgi:hypothetical protein
VNHQHLRHTGEYRKPRTLGNAVNHSHLRHTGGCRKCTRWLREGRRTTFDDQEKALRSKILRRFGGRFSTPSSTTNATAPTPQYHHHDTGTTVPPSQHQCHSTDVAQNRHHSTDTAPAVLHHGKFKLLPLTPTASSTPPLSSTPFSAMVVHLPKSSGSS